jgi:hypothetical protein
MKKPLIVMTAYLLMSAPALSDPKADMCELTSILASEGVAAAMKYTEGLASHWPADQRAKLGVVVGAELERFAFSGGQVYQTAELPGAVEEYFITLNVQGNGSVYLRVLYDGSGGPLNFINIDFKASYYDAIQRPFLQQPKPVPCSSKG